MLRNMKGFNMVEEKTSEDEMIIADFEVLSGEDSVGNWWNNIDGVPASIIQIGAIKVSLADKDLKITEKFNVLVKPRDFNNAPVALTEHIQKLTGIKQARMDEEGAELKEATNSFRDFIKDSIVYNYSHTFDFTALTMSMVCQGLKDGLFDRKQFKDMRPVFIEGGVPPILMPQNQKRDEVLPEGQRTVNSGRIANYLKAEDYLEPLEEQQEHDGLSDTFSVLAGLRKLLAEDKITLEALKSKKPLTLDR